MSTLLDLINNSNSSMQKSVLSLISLRDKLDSVKNKITEWLSKADPVEPTRDTINDAITVALPGPIDDSEEAVCVVTADVFQQALEDEEAVCQLAINSAGDYITATGKQVLDAVNNSIESLQTQSEFISYCLENEKVKATEFSSTLASKFQFVSAQVIEQFSTFFGNGDPIESIKAFMSTFNNNTYTKKQVGQNEYLSISSTAAFTGISVWDVAWNQFVDRTSQFFDGLEFSIFALGVFFEKLWNGILSLSRWLIGKLFKPLTTRFEGLASPIGIMDLPIFQFVVGTYSYVTSGSTTSVQFSPSSLLTSAHQYIVSTLSDTPVHNLEAKCKLDAAYYRSNYGYLGHNYVIEYKLAALCQPCFEQIEDHWYARPYDVIVPLHGGNTGILRVAPTEDGNIFVALYQYLPKTMLESMTDKEIAQRLHLDFLSFASWVSSEAPCLIGHPQLSGMPMGPQLNDLVESIFAAPTPGEGDDNYDLVSKLSCFDVTTTYTPEQLMFFYLGVITFLQRRSAYNQRFIGAGVSGVITDPAQRIALECNSAVGAGESGSLDNYELNYYNLTGFNPYIQNTFVPTAVHYQTLNEQAAEIWHYVLAAIIAAAAIFITVKFIKFKKRRTALAEIRQGYVDNLSWKLPMNPSSEDLTAYNKAKKKAQRTTRLNSLLGLSSHAATSEATNSLVSSVFQRVTQTTMDSSSQRQSLAAATDQLVNTTIGKVDTATTKIDANGTKVDTATTKITTVDGKVDSLSTQTSHDSSEIMRAICGTAPVVVKKK